MPVNLRCDWWTLPMLADAYGLAKWRIVKAVESLDIEIRACSNGDWMVESSQRQAIVNELKRRGWWIEDQEPVEVSQ